MRGTRQHLKLPSSWQPDKWICHHTGSRQSIFMDSGHSYHDHHQQQQQQQYSKDHTLVTNRTLNSLRSPKRISTAKLKEEIDKLSSRISDYRLSTRKSKVKRLVDCPSPKSYKSVWPYTSRRTVTPAICISSMSKQALKRWLDARDAYLGHQHPYKQESFKRRPRRPRRIKSIKKYDKMIDSEAMSLLSINSDEFSILERVTNEKDDMLSQNKSPTKSASHCHDNLSQQVKSPIRSPVRSSTRLSLITQTEDGKKVVKIIHDSFDDKCVGTEISEPIMRPVSNIERCDQAIQVDIARPQFELHHEYDISMVESEKKQRIRSVQSNAEYQDKATETESILNFSNVDNGQTEEKEKSEINNNEDDKTTRHSITEEQEEINSYTELYNVQQQQEQQQSLTEMSDSNGYRREEKKFIPTSKCSNIGHNRVVPLTDLLQAKNNNEKNNHHHHHHHHHHCRRPQHHGSRSSILTSTESNASIHEQIQRYEENKIKWKFLEL